MTLSAFEIDAYAVSNTDFAAFVDDTGYVTEAKTARKRGEVRTALGLEWWLGVERAARGGLAQKRYVWGDELTPDGTHLANIWQGTFPERNTEEDGYVGTAPVDAFPPNGFGLHNTAGNVWEWCADWYSPTWHTDERRETRGDPIGPTTGTRRVNRGGSYLCHHSYCDRIDGIATASRNTPDVAS